MFFAFFMAAILVSSALCDEATGEHRNVASSKLSNLLQKYKKESIDSASEDITEDDLLNLWLERKLAESENFQRFVRKSPRMRQFWKRGPGVREEMNNFW